MGAAFPRSQACSQIRSQVSLPRPGRISVLTAKSRPEISDNTIASEPAFGYRSLHLNHMDEPIVFQKSPIVQKVEPGTYWWCACGRSKSQPFCDGSHKGTGLGPMKTEITEAKTVAWCACKHSKAMPFCDGSHSRIPGS